MALLIHGAKTRTRATTNGKGVYTLAGTWAYALGESSGPGKKRELARYGKAHVAAVSTRGYKLGLKVKSAQTVEHFSFRGSKGNIVLTVDDAVSQELTDAFGVDSGDKWVGLVPPSGKLRRASFDDPGFVTYGYKFVLSGVRYDPQAVVVLVTHRDVPFRQHYIMHVQFVTTRPDRITASTEAMFTARSRR